MKENKAITILYIILLVASIICTIINTTVLSISAVGVIGIAFFIHVMEDYDDWRW